MSIISELERNHEIDNDLALYNKVGDLYVRCNSIPEAVDMYDRAIRRYSELGLGNNAIALCHKILRNAPGRAETYLQLAELMMQRGFVTEAKQKFLEYADRMEQEGKLDKAFQELSRFADHATDTEELRLFLAEQLMAKARSVEAREQLEKLYKELKQTGRKSRATLDRMKAIDPDFEIDEDLPEVVEEKPRKPKRNQDLIFLDLEGDGQDTWEPAPDTPGVDTGLDLEPTSAAGREPGSGPVEVEPLEIERASLDPDGEQVEQAREEVTALDGLDARTEFEPPAPREPLDTLDVEPTALDDAFEVQGDAGDLTIEVPDLELAAEPVQGLAEPADESGEPAGGDSVKFEDADLDGAFQGLGVEEEPRDHQESAVDQAVQETGTEPESDAAGIDELESRILDDPDDPHLHRLLGEKLIETGNKERGLEELSLALDRYESAEDWSHSMTLVEEILRLDNNSIRHHQKRVELAYRAGDPEVLIDSYMSLADAFFRNGAMDRARSVYERILERDPENKQALAALIALQPAKEPTGAGEEQSAPKERPQGDFVDLGELILGEEEPVKDTRMRIQEEEPTGDEQRDFEDMLAQFKKGIDENLGEEDADAHYDLGVAFKEMGLLDEAIAEFQKALRTQHLRLKTSEALGMCFYEKRQFSVAATVLKRASELDTGGDDDKIGVLYWLGRCQEEQGKGKDALKYYQRVFAVDIQFRDVRERVQQLTEAAER